MFLFVRPSVCQCFHSRGVKPAYRPGRPIGRLQEPPSRRLFSFRAEGALRAPLLFRLEVREFFTELMLKR